jgi:hypothetical protein
MASAFTRTLAGFCDELKQTFPELAIPVDRAASVTAATYWKSWQAATTTLLTRDVSGLLVGKAGFLVGAVRLTPELWSELSAGTQAAIWKYLRTLLLEAAMEVPMDAVPTEIIQNVLAILTEERLEGGGAEAEAAQNEILEDAMGHLNPLMERLRGMVGGFVDLSGMKDIPIPDIPAHLRNGRIAQLAEQMAKQFDPTEFGIDPAVLAGDNVEEVLRGLAEMYKRDPSKLVAGAQRMAERIKRQILGGSLNREELIAEAQEFVTLFKEHPLFKEAISKFESFTGGADGLAAMFGGGMASSGAPSERRRIAQERLRKRFAERQAKAAANNKK